VEGQRAFSADASHQLRSPLTALRLRLETIDGAPGGADQAKIGAALGEVDRLNHLVDSLLVLARAGGAAPPTAEVDLAAVLVERWEHWLPVAEARGLALELDLDLDPDGPPDGPNGGATAGAALGASGPDPGSGGPDLVTRAVPGTLDTVLDNLLDNAIGVTPPGGTVRLQGWRRNGEVSAHVLDDGPGMTAEQRARAFDRFWRAPGSSRSGSGLGLAIVADLMAANGGRAELADGPDGGLDASISLAAAPPI
jgi:signal transduction histidine kinase